jgi:predicted RNase H-like HicB family nuclease
MEDDLRLERGNRLPWLAIWIPGLKNKRVTYNVVLIKSDEGFAVGCPALPGCWSQGETRKEALANIKEAIGLWVEVAEEDVLRELDADGAQFSFVSVNV